jgi:hypothetical protein
LSFFKLQNRRRRKNNQKNGLASKFREEHLFDNFYDHYLHLRTVVPK